MAASVLSQLGLPSTLVDGTFTEEADAKDLAKQEKANNKPIKDAKLVKTTSLSKALDSFIKGNTSKAKMVAVGTSNIRVSHPTKDSILFERKPLKADRPEGVSKPSKEVASFLGAGVKQSLKSL